MSGRDDFNWRAYGWGWLLGAVAMTLGVIVSTTVVRAAGGRPLHDLFQRNRAYGWEEYCVMTASFAAFFGGFLAARRLARRKGS
jgi:hypothetical protein